MFLHRLIYVGCVLAAPMLAQTENAACLEHLRIPVYPALAAQARLSGTIRATVLVKADGTPDSVSSTFEGNAKIAKGVLVQAVESALRASSFEKSCGGKAINLVFDFVLGETVFPEKQRVSFGYPNHFWIETTATVWQP